MFLEKLQIVILPIQETQEGMLLFSSIVSRGEYILTDITLGMEGKYLQ